MKKPLAAAVLAIDLLVAQTVGAQGDGSTRNAPFLNGKNDQIVRSAFVPSRWLPQGEVLLLRRGDAVVMQTVLFSSYLDRVVAEIRRKEQALWPPGRQGHADSERYLDALAAAREGIRRDAGQDRPGRQRQKLLIEFILSGRAALLALFEPDIEEKDGHYRVTAKRPISVLDLSPVYVRGNIYEIAWDALRMSREESEALLEPMLP